MVDVCLSTGVFLFLKKELFFKKLFICFAFLHSEAENPGVEPLATIGLNANFQCFKMNLSMNTNGLERELPEVRKPMLVPSG